MCPFGNCKMGSGKLKLFGLKNRDSKVRLMKIIEVKENKKQYLVKNIATVPEYQGKGYARALIEFIVNDTLS